MAEKKIIIGEIVVKKGDVIKVTDVGNGNMDKPYIFRTKVLDIIDDERVAIEYKGKKEKAIWSDYEKWLVATYYTDVDIYEDGQYGTEKIQYESAAARKEMDEFRKKMLEEARKKAN